METLNTNFQENVVAEIKLSYSHKIKPSLRPKIKCSQHASEILRENWDKDSLGFVEEFKVMLVSRCNQVIGICKIGIGGTTCVTVDLKLVFATAIKGNASSIILAHNHPSGNLSSSEQDRRLTQKIKEGCKIFDITLLDHIILTEEAYYSFADEGLL
ncbi:JAB domain-containing protein [Belliella aquatica]|uniref:DNA repair protein n=1 Tax=Belliella aquatica TaxID=1323734 RepID=A0ABQ1LYK7_9BACT|nr:JAB domain-containing protein [Belliella aquatica]MCH7406859.1 JAB domain-containing protein [Belliella aquatica]GGC32135.1 DNA repair protein [Belliella aquatica]